MILKNKFKNYKGKFKKWNKNKINNILQISVQRIYILKSKINSRMKKDNMKFIKLINKKIK